MIYVFFLFDYNEIRKRIFLHDVVGARRNVADGQALAASWILFLPQYQLAFLQRLFFAGRERLTFQ